MAYEKTFNHLTGEINVCNTGRGDEPSAELAWRKNDSFVLIYYCVIIIIRNSAEVALSTYKKFQHPFNGSSSKFPFSKLTCTQGHGGGEKGC